MIATKEKFKKRWFSTKAINKTWRLSLIKIRFQWRRADGFMGRFGGGWNWAVGMRLGGNTILVDLLLCTLTVSIDRTVKPPEVKGEVDGQEKIKEKGEKVGEEKAG